MKAILLSDFGSIDHMHIQQISTPTISEQEVLVEVKAISINPVDVKTRVGKGIASRLKDQKPIILGWDISGIVTQVGKNVTAFKKGDEVFGMVNFPGHGRAYAEFVAVPANQLALKPENISHSEAAAATLAALTAWQALSQAKIKAGQKVLIHAAAGGVGHYAVQMAKYLGAYVIGTSSEVNKDLILDLGADMHFDYKNQTITELPSDIDFVFDTVGGDNVDLSINIVKPGGTVISIPSGLSDSITEKAKAKGVNGFFFMVQSSGEDMKSIANLLAKGVLKSHVMKTFTFDQIGEAHAQLETSRTKGKVVVIL